MLKKATDFGIAFSALLLLMWPMLLIPGAMAIGTAKPGDCFRYWAGIFICGAMIYPLLFLFCAGFAWLMRRFGAPVISLIASWAPFLFFSFSAVLAFMAG